MSTKRTLGQDAPASTTANQRVYKSTQEVDHDLFKLRPATMQKNVSFSEIPQYEPIEHCHIFHTVDSNGTRQETCNAVGGHFHKMEVVQNADGVPTVRCSKPMRWVQKKVNGRFQKMLEEFSDDKHTHDVQYLGSEKIKLRETNMEAAKLQAMVESREKMSVEGVVG